MLPHVTVTAAVLRPAVILANPGKFHLYANPSTAGTLYFSPVCNESTEVGPLMFPGFRGRAIIVFDASLLVPQLFPAFTVSVPVVKFDGACNEITDPSGAVLETEQFT